jgi:GMP synthase-like glutamine amidotransferase
VVVQHVAHEGPGAVAGAIASSGGDCTLVRIDRGDAVPPTSAVEDMAGLVVLGGPMSVHEDLGWLSDERKLMAEAVQSGLPVLGICLGAQQLALALGAEVTTGPAPTPLPCMHWHGDTFTLPPGSVLLASSDAYPHQAFRVGSLVYGLQFHVEVTAALAGHWGPHLPPGVIVRAPDVAHIARHGAGVVARFVALATG